MEAMLDFALQAEEDHFASIMKTIAFFALLFVGGKLFEVIGGAPLVAEIIIGIIFGPNGINFVPEPEAVQLYGEIGLMLLLLEAGLSVDIGMMKQLGAKAVFVAILGSTVPIGMGLGITLALGYDIMSALAIGCVLAPTSTGIAIEVFKSMGALSSPVGQLVTTAAVIDDVISLVILAELQAFTGPTTTWLIIRPILTSSIFVIVLGALSVLVPGYMAMYPGSPIQRIPFKYHKSILLTVVIFYGAALAAGCHYAYSSHLLGAFLAGLGFCRVKMLEHHWEKHVSPVLNWLLKAFFAATVAFEVPKLEVFLDGYVIGVGFLFLLPVFGKLLTGFFARPLNKFSFLKVGFAMAAWGEIAFIIATVVRDSGLIDERLYASVVFAVLISALFSPFILRFLLVQEQKAKNRRKEEEARGRKSQEVICWSLLITCNPQWSLFDAIAKTAQSLNLDVLEAKLTTDHSSGKASDRITLRDDSAQAHAPERKTRLKEAFQKCVNDPEAELTLYRYFGETEMVETPEEFVHVDPDLLEEEEESEGEQKEQTRPEEESSRLLAGYRGSSSYGGTN